MCESAEFLKPASSISPRILTSSAWWPDHPFRTACKGWSAAMLGSRSHTEKKAASKGEQKGNDAQRRVPINQSINLPITSSSVEHVITVLIAPWRVIPHTHTHTSPPPPHTHTPSSCPARPRAPPLEPTKFLIIKSVVNQTRTNRDGISLFACSSRSKAAGARSFRPTHHHPFIASTRISPLPR